MLKSLFEIVLFEDTGNQWSLSRPMLSMILISEQVMSTISRKMGGASLSLSRPTLFFRFFPSFKKKRKLYCFRFFWLWWMFLLACRFMLIWEIKFWLHRFEKTWISLKTLLTISLLLQFRVSYFLMQRKILFNFEFTASGPTTAPLSMFW